MTVGEMIDTLKGYTLDATMTFTSWVPVTLRLPDPFADVIVTRADGSVGVGRRLALMDGTPINGSDANGFMDRDNNKVIAWQYFPAPYDGVECSEELKV